jgi:hypothetical protein
MDSAESLFLQLENASQLVDNSWKVKQSDFLDSLTSHIYHCSTIDELRFFETEKSLSVEQFAYSVHRWRNFKRHEAWLALLFEQVPQICLPQKSFLKTQDFIVRSSNQDIPFDLKITRYPKSANPNLDDAQLAEWFYRNQSGQGRFHLANRFFIVGQPEAAIYDLKLARETISGFVTDMSRFRHFINHSNGTSSRAVVLRQVGLREV